MVTYHNDPAVKSRLLSELAEDEAADRFLRGTYGEGKGEKFRGCSVGCQTRRYPAEVKQAGGDLHSAFPLIWGWPAWLAHLEDYLFENVAPGRASHLSREIADAMPVGLTVEQTDRLRHKFLAWILRNALVYDREKAPEVGKVVDEIAGMHEEAAEGRAAWSAAESAAKSAAWFAAWSAAESAAKSAAADKMADAMIAMLREIR
jgi:hypothetical protein